MLFGSHRKRMIMLKLISSNDPKHLMHAEQTVARMNGRLKLPLTHSAREGLIAAMLRVAQKGELVYGQYPFRTVPKSWTLSNLISRVVLRFKSGTKLDPSDTPSLLADTNNSLKQSGAVGLVIAMLIALIIGITEFGEPAELGVQMGRDALHRTAASGDIVIIDKNEVTAQRFGGLPWARRYDAQLVDRLNELGVKRIVFNAIYADPTNSRDDKAFAQALARANGKVWLSIEAEDKSNPAMQSPVVPQPQFAAVTQQAHGNLRYGVLGQIKHMPSKVAINAINYRAKAAVLADKNVTSEFIKPDYAIDLQSIPTISAADVVDRKADSRELAGKTVVVVTNSERIDPSVSIFGQGRAPVYYSYIIAAETLKRGAPKYLGFALPLLAALIIGLCWVRQRTRSARAGALIGGTLMLVSAVIAFEQFGIHMELIPALFALTCFGFRESRHGIVLQTTATHAVSGLPAYSQLLLAKSSQPAAVVAVKVARYNYLTQKMDMEEERAFALAIASRINIIAPTCEVHHGDDGRFVFVATPDSGCVIANIVLQLEALFTFPVAEGMRDDIDVIVGVDNDQTMSLSMRAGRAVDRSERAAFTRLKRLSLP
jgi:diguanylate cyclase